METPERIRNALACQIGTEHYWKVFPGDDAFKITDGVKTMAEMCEAHSGLLRIYSPAKTTQKQEMKSFRLGP